MLVERQKFCCRVPFIFYERLILFFLTLSLTAALCAGGVEARHLGNSKQSHFFKNMFLAQLGKSENNKGKEISNNDIIEMSKSGLSSKVIISTIERSQNNFDLSPSSILILKKMM